MATANEASQTIVLYGFPKQPGVPSGSAFCQKLETYFRFSGVPYIDIGTYPQKGPKGKLPYVQLPDGTILADSHFIVRHFIKEDLVEDLDIKAGLSDLEKAESIVWRGYWEDHVVSHLFCRSAFPNLPNEWLLISKICI